MGFIIACGIVVLIAISLYLGLFYLLFSALYGTLPTTSTELVLNLILLLITLLSLPIFREIFARLKTRYKTNEVNVLYIISRLNQLAGKKLSVAEIAEISSFLAYQLHFDYVGLIYNGKLYGSNSKEITPSEIRQFTMMKRSVGSSVWQEPNQTVKKTMNRLGIKAVAELRDSKDRTTGQLLIGKPISGQRYDRYNMAQIEMIINLVADVIDLRKYARK